MAARSTDSRHSNASGRNIAPDLNTSFRPSYLAKGGLLGLMGGAVVLAASYRGTSSNEEQPLDLAKTSLRTGHLLLGSANSKSNTQMASAFEQFTNKMELVEGKAQAMADSPTEAHLSELTNLVTGLGKELEHLSEKYSQQTIELEKVSERFKILGEQLAISKAEYVNLQAETARQAALVKEFEAKEADRLRKVHLKIDFVLLDVYLDGSKGKDCWSVNAKINNVDYPIWERKKDISDNCNSGNGPGPNGDKSSCRYHLHKSFTVTMQNDQMLEVGFEGTAHDNNDSVPYAKLDFSRDNNWGIAGGGHEANGYKLHRMGNYVSGQTEYYVFFSVTQVAAP